MLYDSRDLVTHAVIVGMTGSGKTGLGLSLIEEAAIDGVPGPGHRSEGRSRQPAADVSRPRAGGFPAVDRRGGSRARQGSRPTRSPSRRPSNWRKGLADWGQDGARIKRLRDAADFAIYTPGSRAGIPVSILRSFAAPAPAEREDAERMAEAVTTTATGVLTLLGIDADPVQSREHILLSAILNEAWLPGRRPRSRAI